MFRLRRHRSQYFMKIVGSTSTGGWATAGFFFAGGQGDPKSGRLILFAQPVFALWLPPDPPERPDPPEPPEPPDRPPPPELPDPLPPERLEPLEAEPPRSLTPRNTSQQKAAVTTTIPKMVQPFLAGFRCAWLCEKR